MPSYASPPNVDRPAFTPYNPVAGRASVDGQRQAITTGGTAEVRPEKDPIDSTVSVTTTVVTKS